MKSAKLKFVAIKNPKFENVKIFQEAKIAGFDLDHTLIRPESGAKFPKNKNDWMFQANVISKLKELHNSGYIIVVFTNQSPKDEDNKRVEDLIYKMNKIMKLLDCIDLIFISIN